MLGYGEDDAGIATHELPAVDLSATDILVIDDAGLQFRMIGQEKFWGLADRPEKPK